MDTTNLSSREALLVKALGGVIAAAVVIGLGVAFWGQDDPSGISYSEDIEMGQHRIVLTDSSTRSITSAQVAGKAVTCAEPSPDSARNIASTALQSIDNGGQANAAIKQLLEYLSDVEGVDGRTHTIQLLRDGLFRACEAYQNQAINEGEYTLLANKYANIMVTLLAIEELSRLVGDANPPKPKSVSADHNSATGKPTQSPDSPETEDTAPAQTANAQGGSNTGAGAAETGVAAQSVAAPTRPATAIDPKNLAETLDTVFGLVEMTIRQDNSALVSTRCLTLLNDSEGAERKTESLRSICRDHLRQVSRDMSADSAFRNSRNGDSATITRACIDRMKLAAKLGSDSSIGAQSDDVSPSAERTVAEPGQTGAYDDFCIQHLQAISVASVGNLSGAGLFSDPSMPSAASFRAWPAGGEEDQKISETPATPLLPQATLRYRIQANVNQTRNLIIFAKNHATSGDVDPAIRVFIDHESGNGLRLVGEVDDTPADLISTGLGLHRLDSYMQLNYDIIFGGGGSVSSNLETATKNLYVEFRNVSSSNAGQIVAGRTVMSDFIKHVAKITELRLLAPSGTDDIAGPWTSITELGGTPDARAHVVKLTGMTSGRLTLDLKENGRASVDPKLQLFRCSSSECTLIASNDDIGNADPDAGLGERDSRISFPYDQSAGGSYYAVASAFSSGNVNDMEIRLTQ